MTEIILENSLLWLIPIAAVAAGVSWLLYFQGKVFTKGQRLILAALRFFTLFTIGFLLLSPLLRSTKIREEKPYLIWLEDHSSSMVSSQDSLLVKKNLNDYKIPSGLSEKYQIQYLEFTDKLVQSGDSFTGGATDIYEALQRTSEKYYNQNVGAVVLNTDGISNRGGNPYYVARGTSYPIYTVGYGDTTLQKDLFIERVISNKVSYLNNNMPVEVYLRGRKLMGSSFKLTVRNSRGATVYERSYKVNSEDYFERANFYLKSDKAGIQRYTVNVEPLEGESNTDNNRSAFSVEVLDNKKKITILAHGPHPDVGALHESLKNLERYEIHIITFNDLNGELEEADLYILHNPSEAMLDKAKNIKKPLWIIYGPDISPGLFNEVTGVKTEGGSFEEVYAVKSSEFSLFSLDEDYELPLEEMPPLQSPFGDITSSKPIYSLFTKKIGSVTTTSPLYFFVQEDDQRMGIILGTGIWRWRMYDFKENNNHEAFDRLVSKSVQYLTTDARRQRFVIDMPERLEQNEVLRAEGRLYNRALELTNQPDVKIKFISESGSEYDFSFSKSQNTYSLNAGRLPEGVYTYQSTVQLGDESFSRKGSLVVEKSLLEQADLVARHHALRKISAESGGRFYRSDQLRELMQSLDENTNAQTYSYEESYTESLIHKKWLLTLFVLFLTAEWGLRKYFGNY